MASLDKLPAQLAKEAIEHLRALLRFDTTNPPGNEIAAVRYLETVLRDAGIGCKIYEPAPGRASLIARLPGRGNGEPLLLTSHLDVVPAEREHWSVEPFTGEVHDGCLYGRGAVDMKGLTAMELVCMLELKRSGLRLERDVIFAAVADEEAGRAWGSEYLVDHVPEAVQAGYCLNEVGGFSVNVGGRRLYPIGVAEKGFGWLELSASGQPGHASMPHDQNAVNHLAQALVRINDYGLGHAVHPVAQTFIDALAKEVGGLGRHVLRAVLHPRTAKLALRMLAHKQPEKAKVFHAMTHTTATPTVLAAGGKTNVIPSSAIAHLDCRLPPHVRLNDVVARVRDLAGPHIQVRELARGESCESSTSTPLYRLMVEAIERADPGARVVPWLNVGFSDSSQYARLGTQCYGFFPLRLPADLQFSELFHGHDERVPLESFDWGVQVFFDVVSRFATSADGPT